MAQARANPMERSHCMSEVIVIGAGMGGMCTAARLSWQGHRVRVLESSDQPGGKCRTEWVGKYAFDTGPSLLTLPAVYRDFFARTGKHLGQVLDVKPVDPAFEYRFSDGISLKFANLAHHKTQEEISRVLGAESAAQWDALIKRAERMWDVSREPFVESELRSIFALVKRPTLLRDLKVIAPWKSLRNLAHELLPDKHLRYILDRYATYSGSDPRLAPAVLSTIAFVEEAFGAWHITGGIGQLSQAVYQRCIDLGVEFEFNTRVQKINHTQSRVTGVTLADGRIIESSIVVANADASLVYNSLINTKLRRIKGARKRIKQSTQSLAGFSLLLGLRPDSTAEKMNHHTILFPENYDAEFDAIFTTRTPVKEPTIYLCSPHDETMVKENGAQSIFVLVNAPIHDETGKNGWNWNDKNFNRDYANSIIDRIESRGISIRDRLDVLEIRTPADLEKSVNAPGGAIYGTSSNGAKSAFLRAQNRSPLKGLYCVGGSAHPGGGLPLVGLSAEIVANAIGNTQNASRLLH
jgi:phytoene desaturase